MYRQADWTAKIKLNLDYCNSLSLTGLVGWHWTMISVTCWVIDWWYWTCVNRLRVAMATSVNNIQQILHICSQQQHHHHLSSFIITSTYITATRVTFYLCAVLTYYVITHSDAETVFTHDVDKKTKRQWDRQTELVWQTSSTHAGWDRQTLLVS